MRNLVLLRDLAAQTTIRNRVSVFCIDSASRIVYCVTDNLQLICYDLENRKVLFSHPLCLADGACPDDNDSNDYLSIDETVMSISYLHELESLVCCTKAGSILIYNFVTHAMELVGSIIGGVAAAAWSPDFELFALITRAETDQAALIIMSRDWQLLFEVPLSKGGVNTIESSTSTSDSGRGLAAITWRGDGQFFATSHERTRQQCVWSRQAELQSSAKMASGQVCGQDLLVWRPDGNVITAMQQTSQTLQVIFYERNGLRHGEFAVPPFVKCPLSVAPASTDTSTNTTITQLGWSANSDILAVLCQQTSSDRGVVSKHGSWLLLYTMNNYHYYLKYSFCHGGAKAIQSFQFDPEKSDHIVLFDVSGGIRWLQFVHDTCVSTSSDYTAAVIDVLTADVQTSHGHAHSGVVARAYSAVDFGSCVRLTSLARSVVPPPMSASQIMISSPANQLAYLNHGEHSGALAVLSANGQLSMFDPTCNAHSAYEAPTLWSRLDLGHIFVSPHFVPSLRLASVASVTATNLVPIVADHISADEVRHLQWLEREWLGFVVARPSNPNTGDIGGDFAVLIRIQCVNLEATIVTFHVVALPSCALRSFSFRGDFYIELSTGAVHRVMAASDSSCSLTLVATLPSPCLFLNMIEMTSPVADAITSSSRHASSVKTRVCLVGLDHQRRLWLDQHLLTAHCTSIFTSHPNFLIFTTGGQQHKLHCVDRTRMPAVWVDISDVSEAKNDATATGWLTLDPSSERSIERGGVLVAAVAGVERVVLQQPRGNLESVCPRILILRCCRELLTKQRYREAFLLLRTHRVDLNVLYDHSPSEWVHEARDFVRQLASEDYLNLFLSSLSNEDVIQSKFPFYYSSKADTLKLIGVSPPRESAVAINASELDSHADTSIVISVPVISKVNMICETIRRVLFESDPTKYVLSVLTTFVKQSPANHASALTHVRNMRLREATNSAPCIGTTSSDALKYVIFLADVNELYLVALGMYDFELVMMVAQCSQKDPKEYIPYLERLRALPIARARYEIDILLKRWEGALGHLASLGDEAFDEFLSLMNTKALYLPALSLFPAHQSPKKYLTILRFHADDLLKGNAFLSAGFAYRTCGEFNRAMDCFCQAGDADSLLIVCGQAGLDRVAIAEWMSRVAVQLVSLARYAEAARLLLVFAGDVDEGVALLAKAHSWLEALRAAYQYGRSDLIECGLQAAIEDEWINKRAEIQHQTHRLIYSIQRLAVVRATKAQMKNHLKDDDDRLYDDTASLASGMSTSSNLSRYTLSSQISDYDSNASEIRKAFKDAKRKKRVDGKQAKKKIKEGHPLEEEFLVKQLRLLDPSVFSRQPADELSTALVLLNRAAMASLLQKELDIYVALYKRLAAELPPTTTMLMATVGHDIVASTMSSLQFLKLAHVSLDANQLKLPEENDSSRGEVQHFKSRLAAERTVDESGIFD